MKRGSGWTERFQVVLMAVLVLRWVEGVVWSRSCSSIPPLGGLGSTAGMKGVEGRAGRCSKRACCSTR